MSGEAAMDETNQDAVACAYGPWRRATVSAFILFHWTCVGVWIFTRMSLNLSGDAPGATPAVMEKYLFAASQWQYWNMFAPLPGKRWEYSSVWIEANVDWSNGDRERVCFPRPSQCGFFTAAPQAAFIKMQHRLLEPQNERYRRDLAMYVARKVAREGQRAKRITLTYHVVAMPPPPSSTAPSSSYVDYTQSLRRTPEITSRAFHRYNVDSR